MSAVLACKEGSGTGVVLANAIPVGLEFKGNTGQDAISHNLGYASGGFSIDRKAFGAPHAPSGVWGAFLFLLFIKSRNLGKGFA